MFGGHSAATCGSAGTAPPLTDFRRQASWGSAKVAPVCSASPSGSLWQQPRRQSGRAQAVAERMGPGPTSGQRLVAPRGEEPAVINIRYDQGGDRLLAFRACRPRHQQVEGLDRPSQTAEVPPARAHRRGEQSSAAGPPSTTGNEGTTSRVGRGRRFRDVRGPSQPSGSSSRVAIDSGPASCLVKDPGRLIGWEVVLADGGMRSGRVTAVSGPSGCGATMLKVFGPGWGHDSDIGGLAQDCESTHLIPFAKGIVQGLDIDGRKIFIRPPEGLLELSQRRMLLKWLDPQLEELAAMLSQADPGHKAGMRHKMPTKKQLIHCGRRDLIPAIKAAGGFLEVAHELNFRHRRKPAGYWDNLDTVDQEISRFIAANWVELSEPESVYFYNQITGRVSETEPRLPTMELCEHDGQCWTINEDIEDRVMPSVAEVCSAGRYDLHHGILYNGGYRKVARELHRPPSYPRFKPQTLMELAHELEDIMEEEGLGTRAPTPTLLYDIGKHHLMQVIQGFGGYPAVVEKLQQQGLCIHTRRRAKHWEDIDVAVQEIRDHMLQSSVDGKLPEVLPTHRELISAGRHDLRYALQKHGHLQVARRIGVRVNRRGRPSAQKAVTPPAP